MLLNYLVQISFLLIKPSELDKYSSGAFNLAIQRARFPNLKNIPPANFHSSKRSSSAVNNRAKLPFAEKISQENTICERFFEPGTQGRVCACNTERIVHANACTA